jgi:hypothetical protein
MAVVMVEVEGGMFDLGCCNTETTIGGDEGRKIAMERLETLDADQVRL